MPIPTDSGWISVNDRVPDNDRAVVLKFEILPDREPDNEEYLDPNIVTAYACFEDGDWFASRWETGFSKLLRVPKFRPIAWCELPPWDDEWADAPEGETEP